MGGLGNQLFQLAAMLYLQSHHGTNVRLDLSWFERDLGETTVRAFGLAPVLKNGESYEMPKRLAGWAYSNRNPRLLREQGVDDELLGRLSGARLTWAEGYYQRAEYPLAVAGELRDRLLPVIDSSRQLRAEAIGIHVRIGDYLAKPDTAAHHGLTAANYFIRATSLVRSRIGDVPIRVFTDSPDLVRRLYLERIDGEVEVSTAEGSWDALAELSRCSAIVMSNSTFSWWAAFAATVLRGEPTPVVSPRPWFATASSADKHLLVRGWTQIDREISEAP